MVVDSEYSNITDLFYYSLYTYALLYFIKFLKNQVPESFTGKLNI